MRRPLAALLLAIPLSSSAGIIIGNTGNGLRPVAQREGLAVRWSIAAIRWQIHGLPGPTQRPTPALRAPAGADVLELWLDGPVEITLPTGVRLRLDAAGERLEIPVADPDATGPVALDLVLPAWLEDAVQAAGVLEIGPGHPWYGAALAAVQDGAVVR